MRVLGIDPGSRLTGWGVVEEQGRAVRYLGSGTLVLQGKDELAVRLAAVLAVIGATGVALHEYAPAAVKLAAVGHGQADKDAIVWGVGRRLGLAEPLATDAADALALALCHLQHAPLLAALYAADGRAAAVARGPRSAPARRGSS
ncbi:MAG: hypothetical protein E6J76_12640 [Deltaproteobacteria bacterium]|nr:MAG: hypothetical protein E6J76_12640 [Deltaproteobacteria bacterium]